MSSTNSMLRIASVTALIASACSSGTEPPGPQPGTTVRRASTMDFYGEASAVTLPASVAANSPLTIKFVTFGGGCISRGETEVAVTGLEAQIRPYQYQYYPRADEGCTTDLRYDTNTAVLQFVTSGNGLIRIFGLKQPGGSDIVIERTITVTP
jgi:hypothetical protein